MHNLLGGALARRLLRPGFTRHVGLAFFVRALGAVSLFAMNLVVARALSTDEAGYFFLADAPAHYYRLGESLTTDPAADEGTGGSDGAYGSAVTLQEPGLLQAARQRHRRELRFV